MANYKESRLVTVKFLSGESKEYLADEDAIADFTAWFDAEDGKPKARLGNDIIDRKDIISPSVEWEGPYA